nr:Z1 domain-containing protein [Paenibacillus sp. ATY16]
MLHTLNLQGDFYTSLLKKNNYDVEMQTCIKKTVENLIEKTTTVDRPGMLLGKIQSGKTRTFLGTMALAFDNSYDIVIVLTKGTKALAQQTLERLKKEYDALRNSDQIQIFDIMVFPKNLTGYELDQKMVLVVKKEIKNMARLHEAFFNTYPELKDKRILIVDDEADFASIGFSKSKNEGLNIKKIAGSIDEFRKNVTSSSFLQVTATPYSLYLQPDDVSMPTRNLEFKPIKPSFTTLVPVHDKYIGGEYYFDESENEGSIAYHLYEEVQEDELSILKKSDRRSFRKEECLTSHRVKSLRSAIVNFVVGGCMRRLQDREMELQEQKYSFIIHTEQNKASHGWQEEVIFSIKEQLAEASANDSSVFNELLIQAYDNLIQSMSLHSTAIPPFDSVKLEVQKSLQKGHIMVTIVNSEKDVNELLDDNGQLKLRTPLNIFIGGQILDRGITIGNLIGFYYGRKPKTFQQDTVLQHSRMYGARPIEDLTVTRFYTTSAIYAVMKRIHEFDTALREAFEKGSHDQGVIFIQKDTANKIIPCSPNKILLSSTTTLKPSARLLPVGFKVKSKTHIQKLVTQVDKLISSYTSDDTQPFLMDNKDAAIIIQAIHDSFQEGHDWDDRAFLASLEYLSNQTANKDLKGKTWVLVRKNREATRLKKDGRFENSPDSYQEKGSARDLAQEIPTLVLLKQNGDVEKGWSGHEFWWPVLVTPSNTRTVIFASEHDEINEEDE